MKPDVTRPISLERLSNALSARVSSLRRRTVRQAVLEHVRERAETKLDALELREIRKERVEVENPTVTVRIATASGGRLLGRAIESCLQQDYAHVEVLVVGDACDLETVRIAQSYAADGVRFVNLGRRGRYPSRPYERWQVAGSTPMNVGVALAAGEWIAPCDDDDIFTPDHISTLLDWAATHDAEMVWSQASMQLDDGSWSLTPGPPLKCGRISHGSVLYRSDLSFMLLNRRSHLLDEPADWNLWRRMMNAGVRISYCPSLTYFHFA